MARKGRNIYKRKDGRWEGRVILGYYDGNCRRRYHSVYGKSYTETRAKMQEFREKHRHTRGDGENMEHILYFWLEHKREQWKPSTYAAYRRIVENHLLPYWGKVHPESLCAGMVRKFAVTKKADGLSGGYVRTVYGLLRQALRYYENEHDGVHYKIPKLAPVRKEESKTKEKKIPSIEIVCEVEKALYAAQTPEQAGLLIAVNSGIRIGELCALQWKDVDLARRVIHINKTMQRVRTYAGEGPETEVRIMKPKSESSVRDIPLTNRMAEFLTHKKGEPEEYIVPGKRVVFCEPRTLQYRFERFLLTNGFEKFRFHALRHSFASRCVEAGFDAKTLCEIMGHSDIRTTLQLYVHTSFRQKQAMMERLDSDRDMKGWTAVQV